MESSISYVNKQYQYSYSYLKNLKSIITKHLNLYKLSHWISVLIFASLNSFSRPLQWQTYRLYRDTGYETVLTCPLRTDIVTISFFSHAFSYTTLMGWSSPPVFSQIVMLLLAIRSSRVVGGEQAKSKRTLNIFILAHCLTEILASWYFKHKCTRHIWSTPSSSLILLVYRVIWKSARHPARIVRVHLYYSSCHHLSRAATLRVWQNPQNPKPGWEMPSSTAVTGISNSSFEIKWCWHILQVVKVETILTLFHVQRIALDKLLGFL